MATEPVGETGYLIYETLGPSPCFISFHSGIKGPCRALYSELAAVKFQIQLRLVVNSLVRIVIDREFVLCYVMFSGI